MAVIISGYRANYEINQKNNQILIAAREQYNENKLNKTIVLHRLKNDIYAQMMPYQEGYDYIEVWMKKIMYHKFTKRCVPFLNDKVFVCRCQVMCQIKFFETVIAICHN